MESFLRVEIQKNLTSLHLWRRNRISVHVCFSSFPLYKKRATNEFVAKPEYRIESIAANVWLCVIWIPFWISMQLDRILFTRNHLVHSLVAFFAILCAIECREAGDEPWRDRTLVGRKTDFGEINWLRNFCSWWHVWMSQCSSPKTMFIQNHSVDLGLRYVSPDFDRPIICPLNGVLSI